MDIFFSHFKSSFVEIKVFIGETLYPFFLLSPNLSFCTNVSLTELEVARGPEAIVVI